MPARHVDQRLRRWSGRRLLGAVEVRQPRRGELLVEEALGGDAAEPRVREESRGAVRAGAQPLLRVAAQEGSEEVALGRADVRVGG